MATFRQVHCQFWNDSEVMEFTPEDKLFYLYILTNPRSKQCGITEITIRQMAFELGYSTDTIDTLLIRFQERGKIRYNRETNELAVKNWRKYNPDTSPKVKACIDKELSLVKDTALIQYLYSIDTQTQNKEKDKENNKEKEKENIPTASPEKRPVVFEPVDLNIAKALFVGIQNNDPKAKPPNFDKWANDIRLLRQQDRRTEDEIHRVVHFAITDQFWKSVVLSAANLRKNFQKMFLQLDGRNKGNAKYSATIGNSVDSLSSLGEDLRAIEKSDNERRGVFGT